MAELTLDQMTVTQVSKPTTPGKGSQRRQTTGLSLAQARARASFAFDGPAYLPPDFEFDEASIVEDPADLVVLTYTSPAASLILLTAPVARYSLDADGKRRYLVVADSLEESIVGSEPAARVEQQTGGGSVNVGFVWEKASRLNHIVGNGLSVSEIGRIAASTR